MIDLTKETPLSVAAAAEFMGVDRRTLDRWFRRGLERSKVGGKIYTSREALQRFSVDETERPREAVARQYRTRVSEQAKRDVEELERRFGI